MMTALSVIIISYSLYLLLFYNTDLNTSRKVEDTIITDTLKSVSKRDSIVAFARTLLNVPYKPAGCSKDGFDCSGFVYFVYDHFGITLPRSSAMMYRSGSEADTSGICKGDLILFKGADVKDPAVGHVGIIVSEEGQPVEFIHATSGKKYKVVLTKLSESNYKERYIGVKSYLNRMN